MRQSFCTREIVDERLKRLYNALHAYYSKQKLFLSGPVYASYNRNIDSKLVRYRRQILTTTSVIDIAEPKTIQTLRMLTYGNGSDSQKLVREMEPKQSDNWNLQFLGFFFCSKVCKTGFVDVAKLIAERDYCLFAYELFGLYRINGFMLSVVSNDYIVSDEHA